MKLWPGSRKKKNSDFKPRVKIHIGPNGNVWVDPDEFLAQEEVQQKLREYAKIDLVGKKLP